VKIKNLNMKTLKWTLNAALLTLLISIVAVSCKKRKTAPTITMNGPSSVTLCIGDTYTEAGASAISACGDELDVVIDGSVNVNESGTYTITYTATDEYSNVSTSQTSVVVQVCTSNLLGDYTVAHDCSIDVGLGPIDILNNDQTVLEGTNENEIIIDNFNAFVTQVSGTIEGNTVTIPETTTDILSGAATVSISGVGTINATATEMIITFSYSYDAGFLGTGSGTCTATYTKV